MFEGGVVASCEGGVGVSEGWAFWIVFFGRVLVYSVYMCIGANSDEWKDDVALTGPRDTGSKWVMNECIFQRYQSVISSGVLSQLDVYVDYSSL